MSKIKVLFVCTGNTCRSPMAAGLFCDLIAKKGLSEHFEVLSGGIYANAGEPASQNSVEAMKEYEIDITGHSSQRINQDVLEQADYICALTDAHKQMLVSAVPEITLRCYSCNELAKTEIGDPYGSDLARYRLCAARIQKAVEALWQIIEKNLDQ